MLAQKPTPAAAADATSAQEVRTDRTHRAAFRFLDRAAVIASLKTVRTHGGEVKVTATAKLVAWTLATHANATTGQCNPGQSTLAAETGISVRTVQEALAVLVSIGALRVTHGRGNRASYELLGVTETVGSDTRDGAGPRTPEARNAAGQTRGTARVRTRGTPRVPLGTANVNGEGNYDQRLIEPPERLALKRHESVFSSSDDRAWVGKLVDWHGDQVHQRAQTRPRQDRRTAKAAAQIIEQAAGDRDLIKARITWLLNHGQEYKRGVGASLPEVAANWTKIAMWMADGGATAECERCSESYASDPRDEGDLCPDCLAEIERYTSQAA
jgi:hypothetical protein